MILKLIGNEGNIMPAYLIEILIGTGICSQLFLISRQLGCIKTELQHVIRRGDDHEDRIRALEHGH